MNTLAIDQYSFSCLLLALQLLTYAFLFVRWERRDRQFDIESAAQDILDGRFGDDRINGL